MLEVIQHRLAVKLGLLATVAVAAGFSLASLMSTQTLITSTSRLHRQAASGIASSISSSVSTAMLAGDGAHVRRLVSELRTRLPQVGIRVFSGRGEEVFGAKPPPPDADGVPAAVRAALASGKPLRNGDERVLPMARGERCRACHAEGEVVGVLTIQAARMQATSDVPGAALDTHMAVIRDGFYRVMVARSARRLNEYFAELTQHVPGVRSAAVYGPDKVLSYGTPAPRNAKLLVRVAPLPSEPRCLGCHDSADELDGSTLVVAWEPTAIARDGALPVLIETALEEVMAVGLGRLAVDFLDDVARTGAVSALSLHDSEGRLFHDAFGRPSPPAEVGQVLRTGAAWTATQSDAPEFVFVEPLRNAPPCQSCHGIGETMRGAIEIRLDTSQERAELASLRRGSVAYGAATIILVLVLLALGLYYTVIRPVRAIGSVADQVGAGHLDTSVDVHTSDEMGRLGHRINEMVRGLRQKLELAKFVSRETLHEVESNAGVVARGGERRRLAVVFSDIRGFTSFAESHEPEAVVEMLNRYLQAQADVVIRHGGDIDKFVGDEIMARFVGPDMALRATRAAVEMVEAVAALNAARPGTAEAMAVGVGVNVGDAVLGAVGAERRMDFTAIGDAINLGARLCSAAQPGEVLVTEAVQREVGAAEGLVFMAIAPLMVKGKRDPVAVYRVERPAPQ